MNMNQNTGTYLSKHQRLVQARSDTDADIYQLASEHEIALHVNKFDFGLPPLIPVPASSYSSYQRP